MSSCPQRASLGLLLGCGLLGCGGGEEPEAGTEETTNSGASPEAWFVDRAQEAGIDFLHRTGAEGKFYFPEQNGGGVALLDYDRDGYLDVFLVQCGRIGSGSEEAFSHGLFRNLGDGSFEDRSTGSGIATGGYGMAATAGDFDNDGWPDLYISNVGANVLLRNQGDGTFEDVTEEAGVGGSVWSSAATFSDYDSDGDLDLYVCNYVFWTLETDKACYEASGRRTYCGPHSYNAPVPDNLYRNNGDGTFTEVSAESGLSAGFGNALGVVSGDFNGDGHFDFFVANDRTDDQLWVNQGDGSFIDDAAIAGCAVDREGMARAGMGVDAEDVDNDGDLDLIVVNLHGEFDGFYRNEGRYFKEETTGSGIGLTTRAFTRFGVGFVDFDNDGDLDLYQANGRVTLVGKTFTEDPYAEPNVLMERAADGKWQPAESQGGTLEPLIHTSRGAAFGDLDNDGGMDVVVVNSNSYPYLLRNVHSHRGHWLVLDVLDNHGSPAIGASVYLKSQGVRLRRDVMPGTSYASSSDPRLHFGLGGEELVESLEVHWPDGEIEYFGPFDADNVVTLRRGSGRSAQD